MNTFIYIAIFYYLSFFQYNSLITEILNLYHIMTNKKHSSTLPA